MNSKHQWSVTRMQIKQHRGPNQVLREVPQQRHSPNCKGGTHFDDTLTFTAMKKVTNTSFCKHTRMGVWQALPLIHILEHTVRCMCCGEDALVRRDSWSCKQRRLNINQATNYAFENINPPHQPISSTNFDVTDGGAKHYLHIQNAPSRQAGGSKTVLH